MKRVDIILLIIIALSVLPSCQKEILSPDSDQPTAAIDSLTLTLSLNVAPVAETKGSTRVATKGSEAEKAGFYYEFVPDTTELIQTKAPASLKNVYAFLFNGTTGAYVGKGTLASASANAKLDIKFSQTSATNNCRLIVVAQDGGATLTLPSALTGFTGTYDQFKNVYFNSTVTNDANIPYVGELTGVSAISGSVGSSYTVNLYRMLAKVTLNITNNVSGLTMQNTWTVTGITSPKFYTPNGYDGSGNIKTSDENFFYENFNNSQIFCYLGESVNGTVDGTFTSIQDRNVSKAPTGSIYITIPFNYTKSLAYNTPKVGEEYKLTDGGMLAYDIYLGTGIGSGNYSDFNVRRNHTYTINCTLSGTLDEQIALADTDGRVRLSLNGETVDGYNIGRFGGWTTSSTDISNPLNLTGEYTKDLIVSVYRLESKSWFSGYNNTIQGVSLKYWDHKGNWQSLGNGADQTSAAAFYCASLGKGWYVPSQTQLLAMYTMKEFYYLNFVAGEYLSSTEYDQYNSWYIDFSAVVNVNDSKVVCNGWKNREETIRCVKDL